MMHAMMGVALVPDDMCRKVTLGAIVCATQLDGLIMIEINGKYTMHHTHMFGVNPKWTRNLCIWEEAGVRTVGKDCKTGDKGATMMLVGYHK